MGGALGNVIDRVRFAAVADFLDFHLGDAHWPAFNIADSCIFIGVVVLCIQQYVCGASHFFIGKTIMRYAVVLTSFSLIALAACDSNTVKDTLGLERTAPDEYRVVSRPPLSVPPDFTMRPPTTATDVVA